MPFPDSYAFLAVILASRLPDADVVPLTLVHDPARAHDPARLFSTRDFSSGHSRKNDGETGRRTLDPWHGFDVAR